MSDKEIKINATLLKDMLREAYQAGWYGVLELDEETSDSIIERHVTESMIVKTVVAPPAFHPLPFIGVGVAQGLQMPGGNILQSANGLSFNPNNGFIQSNVILTDMSGSIQVQDSISSGH